MLPVVGPDWNDEGAGDVQSTRGERESGELTAVAGGRGSVPGLRRSIGVRAWIRLCLRLGSCELGSEALHAWVSAVVRGPNPSSP